jgi:hypothetical protein
VLIASREKYRRLAEEKDWHGLGALSLLECLEFLWQEFEDQVDTFAEKEMKKVG